jgi:hypothetical protein
MICACVNWSAVVADSDPNSSSVHTVFWSYSSVINLLHRAREQLRAAALPVFTHVERCTERLQLHCSLCEEVVLAHVWLCNTLPLQKTYSVAFLLHAIAAICTLLA